MRSLVRRVLVTGAVLLAAPIVGGGAGAQVAHGRVITDTLWSPSLGAKKAVVVYLPPSYETQPSRRYPVAYYLHGVSGDETNWSRLGGIATVADSLAARGVPEMILVMPDGDDSWYTTWNVLITFDQCKAGKYSKEDPSTFCVPWGHYDEYVARDLVQWSDRRFRTVADRAHRGIGGLSMGGYGAFTLALGYPDVFAAAASHSGVLSPMYAGAHPFQAPPRYAAGVEPLGELAWARNFATVPQVFGRDSTGWWARDPARRLTRLIAARTPLPALFADVGIDDPYADQSRAFRWEAERAGVAVAYREWPGTHNWAYWRGHVGESLRFLAGEIAK